MGKSDKKTQVLGDDPLAWLNAGADVDKKTDKKKKSPQKKKVKKAESGSTKPKKAKPVATKNKKTAAVEKAKDKSAKTSNHLELESSIVINKAGDINESLKKLIASGQDVEIDASKVEIVDSAILQLFFSFVLSLKEKKLKLTWYKPTEVLLNKASTLGLKERLGM